MGKISIEGFRVEISASSDLRLCNGKRTETEKPGISDEGMYRGIEAERTSMVFNATGSFTTR
jgi:hypothetical protein